MVDRPAHLDPFLPALLQHAVEDVVFDAQCDVQIEIVLALELEGSPRHLEKGEARAVVHFEKGVEPAAPADLEGTDQPEAEELLVKGAGLLGIPAAIRIMVQTLDHPTLPSLQSIYTASLSFQCSRNSRPKPMIGVATPPRRSRRRGTSLDRVLYENGWGWIDADQTKQGWVCNSRTGTR